MQENKINILLVDDKPEKLLTLSAVLEEPGRNIIRAQSGREALRYLLNTEFAVILLDVNMPGMDGFETASLIRQRRRSRDVPIIFVTAMDDETHVWRGYSLGAVDYISMPVIPEVLKTKVSVFVDLYRKTEQVRRQADWLRQRTSQLRQLTKASLAINSALSTGQILRVVTDTAREMLGANLALATLLCERAPAPPSVIRSEAADSNGDLASVNDLDRSSPGSLIGGMSRVVRLSQQELDSYPALQSVANAARGASVRGLLAAPLTGRDGQKLGILEVWDKSSGDFSSDDEIVFVQLAQMASIAVENTLFAAERETNRIKDEFLSTLSHELRSPLNAILGWTRLLRARELPPEVAHGLEVIDRNAGAQTKLIEELLDVSRIMTDKLRLNCRPALLAEMIEAAVESLRPTLESKHLRVTRELSAAQVNINADPDRLQQVFWNLLSNAAKFTPEDGSIHLRALRLGRTVQFDISDSGQGIDPAFLPFVFDRFRQADSTTTRSHGGLGIGLTIVRRIVELHGGSVSAQSAGAGRGSTFSVTLPILLGVERERRDAVDDTAEQRNGRDLSGVRVLIVDDQSDARECIAMTLKGAHASVIEAESVEQALSACAARRPDIVVSDIAMPQRDGYDLIRALRELPPDQGGAVPAIALTAFARPEDKTRALAAGFQLHISKPAEPEELLAAIDRLCRSTTTPI